MKFLQKISVVLERISTYITCFAVLIMFISMLIQVFMRYVVNKPLFWSEELARFCMVLMTFSACFVAVKKGLMANIDLIVVKLNANVQKMVRTVVNLFGIVLLTFLSYLGILLLFEFSVINEIAVGTRIPMRIIYAIMPVGMMGMVFQLIINTLQEFIGKEA